MGKQLIVSFVLILLTITAFSDEKVDFRYIDQRTYEAYEARQWDTVIHYGKLGLKNKIDYYYLRVRLGVAYYAIEDYMFASDHFEKALAFNADSKFAYNYLISCYIFSGRQAEADIMISKLGIHERRALNLRRPSFIDKTYIEAGPALTDNYSRNGNEDLMGKGNLYGEQDLYGNNLYFHVGLGINVAKRLKIYLGYSNLNINKRRIVQYTTLEPYRSGTTYYDWGYEYNYDYPVREHEKSFDYTVKQNELYLNALITLKNGWSITPAFHLLNVGFDKMNVKYNGELFTDTAYYVYETEYAQLFQYLKDRYKFPTKDTSYYDYVVSLSANKIISHFNIGINALFSSLNGQYRQQFGCTLTYYPLGNLKIYGQSRVTGLLEENSSRLVIGQMIGVKASKNMWVEGFASLGDLANMSEENAFIVYNQTDKINFKAGGNIIFTISDMIKLSLRYQLYQKEGEILFYLTPGPENYTYRKTTYLNHQIIGGITWNL
jgi:hypothetical protein